MKVIFHSQQNYILRLDKEEELIESLKKFCQKEKIKAGFFWGLGSASEGELAYYSLDSKKYFIKFRKPIKRKYSEEIGLNLME